MHRMSKRRALTAAALTVAVFVAFVVTTVRARQANPDSLARQLFQQNCSGCHSAEGRGGDRAPSLVGNRTTRGRDEAYFRARTGGSVWSFNANQAWKASPMTYAIEGRQFVAIAGGGGNVLAFALADE